jgi:hypothetical protein
MCSELRGGLSTDFDWGKEVFGGRESSQMRGKIVSYNTADTTFPQFVIDLEEKPSPQRLRQPGRNYDADRRA